MSTDKTTSDSGSKQNKSAGSEETKAKPFPTIDLFHRVSNTYKRPEKMDEYELKCGIGCIVTRAEAVLQLVADQFGRDDDDGGKLNDTILYFSLQSVAMDLADIREFIEAYTPSKIAGQS